MPTFSFGVFGRRRACALLALLAWVLSLFVAGVFHPLPWAGPLLGTLIAFWSNHRRISRPPLFSLPPIAAIDALWGALLATGMASALLWLGDSSFLAWLALAVFALCWKMEWCFPTMGMEACARRARHDALLAWAERPGSVHRIAAQLSWDTTWGLPLVSFHATLEDPSTMALPLVRDEEESRRAHALSNAFCVAGVLRAGRARRHGTSTPNGQPPRGARREHPRAAAGLLGNPTDGPWTDGVHGRGHGVSGETREGHGAKDDGGKLTQASARHKGAALWPGASPPAPAHRPAHPPNP